MKQKILKLTLTGAMLAMAAGAAYGGERPMIARIPFTFCAVGSTLPPGDYTIGPGPGDTKIMQLRNVDSGMTVFLLSKSTLEGHRGEPQLVFKCGSAKGCALATVWSSSGTGRELPTPAYTSTQREREEMISLRQTTQK